MRDKHEAEWLYAKGLELAILIKGPPSKKVKTYDTVEKIIDAEYDAIAGVIMGKIVNGAKEMVAKNLI